MVWNIIDKRTNKYNVWVDAVFEPAHHDNCVEGATQAPEDDDAWSIDWRYKTTIAAAIDVANTEYSDTMVTIFLYDAGSEPTGKRH